MLDFLGNSPWRHVTSSSSAKICSKQISLTKQNKSLPKNRRLRIQVTLIFERDIRSFMRDYEFLMERSDVLWEILNFWWRDSILYYVGYYYVYSESSGDMRAILYMFRTFFRSGIPYQVKATSTIDRTFSSWSGNTQRVNPGRLCWKHRLRVYEGPGWTCGCSELHFT